MMHSRNSYCEFASFMAPHVLLIPAVMMALRTKAPRTVTILTNNSSILRLVSLENKKGGEGQKMTTCSSLDHNILLPSREE